MTPCTAVFGFIAITALTVQLSTTDEQIDRLAGIAVLAAIALLTLGSVVYALVSHVRAVALEAAARRGRVHRLPILIVDESTDEGAVTK